jgi:hypothetical protein
MPYVTLGVVILGIAGGIAASLLFPAEVEVPQEPEPSA